jgi:O-acetyl-ADP-ribose deacetylase (regulator of RNase III)
MVPLATEKKVNKTLVRLQRGDLTALKVDAFVFYARENLQLGAGFGTAIQVRGGDAVKKELEKIGSLQMGEAAITTAGNMQARFIIHACGPKFQEPDAESKLRRCVLAALKLADEQGLKSLAFPPLGAGFYGVPLEVCSTLMLEVIKGFLQANTSVEEIVICVIDKREFNAFKDKLEKL